MVAKYDSYFAEHEWVVSLLSHCACAHTDSRALVFEPVRHTREAHIMTEVGHANRREGSYQWRPLVSHHLVIGDGERWLLIVSRSISFLFWEASLYWSGYSWKFPNNRNAMTQTQESTTNQIHAHHQVMCNYLTMMLRPPKGTLFTELFCASCGDSVAHGSREAFLITGLVDCVLSVRPVKGNPLCGSSVTSVQLYRVFLLFTS